jgi:RNA polymerase sigma factor (sigma-70 family)
MRAIDAVGVIPGQPSSIGATERDVECQQARLFTEQRVAMTRLGYLLTGSVSAAEELVQDGFEQVVRRWDEIGSPGGYLRIAVINGARSWGRRRQRSAEPVDPGVEPPIDSDAIAVRDALAELRFEEREVLVLRYWAGLSDTEVAELVNRPLGTVKSQIQRGLAHRKGALR